MAATPFDYAAPAPFFNIYNDGTLLSLNSSSMPTGPCNFADLNQGANGAKCGCRRFWARSALGGSPDRAEWCMCSHHACFHDAGADSTPVPGPEIPGPGQENEKPKSGRDPLGPVQEASLPVSSIGATMDLHTFAVPTSNTPTVRMNAPAQTNEGSNTDADREPSIPDTLSWGNVLQSQPAPATLPPIPSQCLMGSQATSVTSSVQRYLRPFAGKGLNTLSGATKPQEPLTDKDIPGLETNADGPIPDVLSQNRVHSCQPSPTANSERQPLQPIEGVTREAFKRMSETVTGHDQRLDRLENVSFSATGHEECQEKQDSMDLRITELETRVDEVEKVLNDSSNHAGNRIIDESASVASILTASTSNTAHQADHADIYSQIQSLKAQVSQLSALSPSFGAPWEIEVVFLPFPLKGIWLESSEFSAQRQSGTAVDFQADPWTQLPSSCSAAALPFHSPHLQDWGSQDAGSVWLLPRACAPERLIDRRLRSRGLIRKAVVKGPDARSVHLAVEQAFGSLFSRSGSQNFKLRRPSNPDPRGVKYMGLQEPWVPLRKIHKDSRLRFLAPAEMVTSALWNVSFLSSSVTMKATSIHRLYITQPDAYIQNSDAYESGWTWQEIREMKRYYSDSQDPEDVPEADAKEDCWEWNGRLDEAPTPQSSQSLSLRQSHQGVPVLLSSSPTQDFHTGREFPSISSSRSAAHGARKTPTRPFHIRTASVPPIRPEMMSPALMRRRVASSGYERKGSPMPRAMAMSAVIKRRQTRSPSIRPRNTPRWSTMSPSPTLEEVHQRGVTPFYYATPYSNAPCEAARRGPSVGAGGAWSGNNQPGDEEDEDRGSATDPYDDTDMTHPDDVDESEWHGVQGAIGGGAGGRQPEDEPWPGLPDHPMSDSENVDPQSAAPSGHEDEDDRTSIASSQPSEYPSTQSAWRGNGGGDFRIHEDDDGMDTIRA